jgi:hypothetical protein
MPAENNAVKEYSEGATSRIIFEHTGWRRLGRGWGFLHANGALGADGPIDGVEVSLPGPLTHYRLPAPPQGEKLVMAIQASLRMLRVAPLPITVPRFASIYRAVLGSCDFSTHLTGPTGAGKTELVALVQQHFGAELDARHLPIGWSSTGNSMETLALLQRMSF